MRRFTLFAVLLLLAPLQAQQINFFEITNQYSLPGNVKIYKGVRSSPALQCWYIEVDLKKPGAVVKPYFNPAGREGITAFSNRFSTIAGINGGYFDVTTGASYSALVNPDILLARNIASVVRDSRTYYLTRGFWSIEETRDMAVDWIYHFGTRVIDIYRFTNPLNNAQGTPVPAPSPLNGSAMYEIKAGIGGGPVLIKNGQIRVTYTEEVFWGSGVGLTNRDPRSAIGYTEDKRVILFVADGRQTISEGLSLNELAAVMQSLGCREALNLDGGGSSQMAVGTSLVNRPEGVTAQRAIPTMVAVVLPDSLPLLPAAYLNNKYDTEDTAVCSMTGTWTQSAISGWWGGTPARVAQVGTGERTAEFRLNLPAPGVYTLSAWWVAASDRAKNTPYIIHHANGVDTIRVNQSVSGVRWNTLGEFTFTGTAADRVVISNNATGGNVVCADGLRILSFDSLLTDIHEPGDASPQDFTLLTNYPNPFNPETVISYQVQEAGMVTLKIYDLLGREVSTLVNESKAAGYYQEQFNGSGLPSGIYMAVLVTGSFSRSLKMMLTK
ncbi:MAG: phosphodiester glycosidase family protein [Ignavibacteriaceae bacterium]|nr:phosphodiester glycosidase family protein [Ignavibacteriaceae bacterium]